MSENVNSSMWLPLFLDGPRVSGLHVAASAFLMARIMSYKNCPLPDSQGQLVCVAGVNRLTRHGCTGIVSKNLFFTSPCTASAAHFCERRYYSPTRVDPTRQVNLDIH